MASTNETTNLKLSQFDPSDKPSWLNDYNTDMQKIDAGYAGAVSGTSNLETRVEKNETNIATMKTDINGLLVDYNEHSTLIQQNTRNITTNRNNIDSLDNRVEVLEDDVAGLAGADEWIVLGDSWAVGGYMTTVSSLNPNRTIYDFSKIGAGLTPSDNNFLLNLQQKIDTIPNKGKVSRIFVFGFLNDAWANASYGNIKKAILELSSYCKATFPHGKIYFGALGGIGGPDSPINVYSRLRIIEGYQSSQTEAGETFIDNMQYLHLNYDTLFEPEGSKSHPSPSGYIYLGNIISGVMNNLTCPLLTLGTKNTTMSINDELFTTTNNNITLSTTLTPCGVWCQTNTINFSPISETGTEAMVWVSANSLPYMNMTDLYVDNTTLRDNEGTVIAASYSISGGDIKLRPSVPLKTDKRYSIAITINIPLAWC